MRSDHHYDPSLTNIDIPNSFIFTMSTYQDVSVNFLASVNGSGWSLTGNTYAPQTRMNLPPPDFPHNPCFFQNENCFHSTFLHHPQRFGTVILQWCERCEDYCENGTRDDSSFQTPALLSDDTTPLPVRSLRPRR